jgi:lysophospholipase L1-like esterase
VSALRRKERLVLIGDSLSGNSGIGTGGGNPPIVTWFGPDENTETFGSRMRERMGPDAPAYCNAGISGDNTGQWLAGLPIRVYPQNPTAAINLIGINDITQGKDLETYSRPNIAAGLDGILTNCPRLEPGRLYVMSLWLFGEHWPDGANGHDTEVNDYNAMLLEEATNVGAVYCDVRGPTFDILPTVNPDNDQSGILTGLGDLIHPRTLGAGVLSDIMAALIPIDLTHTAP